MISSRNNVAINFCIENLRKGSQIWEHVLTILIVDWIVDGDSGVVTGTPSRRKREICHVATDNLKGHMDGVWTRPMLILPGLTPLQSFLRARACSLGSALQVSALLLSFLTWMVCRVVAVSAACPGSSWNILESDQGSSGSGPGPGYSHQAASVQCPGGRQTKVITSVQTTNIPKDHRAHSLPGVLSRDWRLRQCVRDCLDNVTLWRV